MTETSSSVYKVDVCPCTFSTIKGWNLHHRVHHKTILTCNRKFRTLSAHRAHRNMHAPLKFFCKNCGSQFPYSSALCIHKRVHVSHICFAGACNKLIKWSQDLYRHVQKHLQINHKCEECYYSKYEKQMLKHHKIKHQFKYCCPKCEYKSKYLFTIPLASK